MTNIELKEFLNDKINGNHEHILQLLQNIETQTTKTNGRVTLLEGRVSGLVLDESKHYQNCPNSKRIEVISEEMTFYRMLIKYPKVALYGLIIAVGSIFATVGYGVYEIHQAVIQVETKAK